MKLQQIDYSRYLPERNDEFWQDIFLLCHFHLHYQETISRASPTRHRAEMYHFWLAQENRLRIP